MGFSLRVAIPKIMIFTLMSTLGGLPQTFILATVVAVSSHLYFLATPLTFSLFAMAKIPPFLFSLPHNLSGKLGTFRFAQNFPERPTLPTLNPPLLKSLKEESPG